MKLNDKNSIAEAIKAGRVQALTVSARVITDKRIREIMELAAQAGVRIYDMPATKGGGRGTHKGAPDIEATCSQFQYTELSQIGDRVAQAGKHALILAVDHIQDPRNLGAIIRSAAAAAADGIIIERTRCCDITETVYETSCGGVEHVPIAKVSNLRQAIVEMKSWGCWIAGADERAVKSCYDTELGTSIVIVVGSEGDGLSRIVAEECDFLMKIPTLPQFPSLNASVAASVLMFEARRQKEGL